MNGYRSTALLLCALWPPVQPLAAAADPAADAPVPRTLVSDPEARRGAGASATDDDAAPVPHRARVLRSDRAQSAPRPPQPADPARTAPPLIAPQLQLPATGGASGSGAAGGSAAGAGAGSSSAGSAAAGISAGRRSRHRAGAAAPAVPAAAAGNKP